MCDVGRGVGYTGWQKSLYAQNWFDSGPERDLAGILDPADGVSYRVRLLRGDLEIVREGGRYNPDFVAVESNGTHWLVEVKSDKGAADKGALARIAPSVALGVFGDRPSRESEPATVV